MGNVNDKPIIKLKNVDVYTKGENGKCKFVYSYNNILEPHTRKIEMANKIDSEILAIIKALETLDGKKENVKINVYSSCQEAITYINNSIFYRNENDINSSKILLLTSDKIVNFYKLDKQNNIFIKTMLIF